MTVITPEMEKKQEEAMDKFLAKQVKQRENELRRLWKRHNVSLYSHDTRCIFVRTYIPLAKYHARTYKEEEGAKSFPFDLDINTTELYCLDTKTYRKFPILRFGSGKADTPVFNQPLLQAKNRTLATVYIDGFFSHKHSGYFISPEGWVPPAEWGVEDKREKKPSPK